MWGDGGHYHRWASFLERWGAGEQVDPATLPALSPQDFTGDSWERFTLRLTDALSKRLQLWADELTRAMGEARDEFGVARALGQSRSGLRTVRALAAHPGIPEELRSRVAELMDRQVRSAQKSLEDQVDSMRRSGVSHRDVEARRRTIRDNSLLAVTREETLPVQNAQSDGERPARRRVIHD